MLIPVKKSGPFKKSGTLPADWSIIAALCFLLLGSVWPGGSSYGQPGGGSAGSGAAPISVIFETDLGNDVDDALALDMLYKYADQGKVRLLAISSNKDNIYSTRFIRLMNRWYGYPGIPVGAIDKGPDRETKERSYAEIAYDSIMGKPAGKSGAKPDAKSDTKPDAKPEESTALYRRVLAAQPDHSVVIVSVGFSTNLARLLETGPDQSSPLSGKELVARKVKLLSMMAGNFEGKRLAEFNVEKDAAAAGKVFSEWPGPVVTSPFELGIQILYPATVIEGGFTWAKRHPVVVAYKSYLPMPYDRPTWDLTAVLYAVEGGGWFHISPPGTISVDEKGFTTFTADPSGSRRYLEVNREQASAIRERLIHLTTDIPVKYRAKR